MSLDASGTLGKAFVASKWKGRNYMRRHVIPSNPRSDNQTANRAMMAFLSQGWALLSAGVQADWTALAAQGNFSPFNAFVRFNMNRWKQFSYPMDSPLASAAAPSAPALSAPVGGIGQFQITITEGAGVLNWGTVLFVDLTVDPTEAKQLVKIITQAKFTADLVHIAVVNNLLPGTYRAKALTFNAEGEKSALSASSGDIVVT
jgi:hypothetical protein